MIHTWAAGTVSLQETEKYRFYYNSVPQFRKEKADRLRFAQDKAQSVGAWVLLERMRRAYGLYGDVVFNLSHSGTYVLCSIAEETEKAKDALIKVGCDIEVVKDARMEIADRFFCKSESRYIREQKSDRQAEAFCRYWVLKESFMKATRRGMGLDLASFEIGFSKEGRPVLIRQPEEIKETYYYKEYSVEGVPAMIAVCSTENEFDEIRYEGEL